MDYLVYGKIIIDTVRLASGEMFEELLGGGGPQAVYGARIWTDSVGFLTRSGTDISAQHREQLKNLGADLAGWARYPDLNTIYGKLMAYDEDEFSVNTSDHEKFIASSYNWRTMLARPLSLPEHYQQPKAIHLITEHFTEPMVSSALELRQAGAVFSLEPLIDFESWGNRTELLELLPQVDIVTPDWPSASGIAGTQDPRKVLTYWSKLGPNVVAVRHGPNGSYVWDKYSDESWHIPIAAVTSIDPTGAGNSYGAGLCVGWVESENALKAAAFGTVSASIMVQSVGLPVQLDSETRRLAEERLAQLLPRAKQL